VRNFIPLAGAVALIACAPVVRAQSVIISDGFSGMNGAALDGRMPDTVDLPGTSYSTASNNTGVGAQPTIDTTAGNPAPSANTGFNASTFIDISSTGSYSKPTELTLSISLQLNTIQDDNTAGDVRGIFDFFPQRQSIATGRRAPSLPA